MITQKEKSERRQIEIFSMEEFVPKDHLLRKIEAAVDFTRIYHTLYGVHFSLLALSNYLFNRYIK